MMVSKYDGWSSATRVFSQDTIKYSPAYDSSTGDDKSVRDNYLVSDYMLDEGATSEF